MRLKLGEILVELGSVVTADVEAALEQQSSGDPARIGDLLIAAGKVTPLQLAKALCLQSGLPFVQLNQVSPEVAALVPLALQRQHCLVPFKEDGRGKAVHVAVADPTTHDVLAELEFQVGRSLRISIAARDEIEAVHAALGGDVLDGAIVEDEPPVPVPMKSPQPLARVALKRMAVSAEGSMTEHPPSPPPPPPPPSAPVAGNYLPTLEIPVTVPATLPPRAARPKPALAPPPPMLKPVDAPGPAATAPARPKSKAVAAVKKVEADEWAVRPAASAIPKGSTRPTDAPAPPVLDPFAAFPTEEIGGPREYLPAPPAELPPLSALDADPLVSDGLRGPELPLGRDVVIGTKVEFKVPPPSIAPSKIAIEPAPLALDLPVPTGSRRRVSVATHLELSPTAHPPKRKLVQTLETQPAPPPAPSVLPSAMEVTVSAAPRTASKAIPSPVPSGRDRPVETQLEFSPPALSIRAKQVSTEPEYRPFFEDPGERLGVAAPVPPTGAAPETPPEEPPKSLEVMEPPPREPESADAFGLEARSVELPPEPVVETNVTMPVELPPPVLADTIETAAVIDEPVEEPPPAPLPRAESLEFIPPAETAPRPPIRLTVAARPPDALEYVPPSVPPSDLSSPPTSINIPRAEPRSATPPGGTSAAQAPLEAPGSATPADGTPAVIIRPPATPPGAPKRTVSSENLVSGSVVPPATLAPSEETVAPPPADALLTPAPLEEPPAAEPSAPKVSEAPIDLAVSELPAWMREAHSPLEVPADPLTAALAAPGALERVVRLLIDRGLVTEAEVLERLRKEPG